MDSANLCLTAFNLRIPLTICGFHFTVANYPTAITVADSKFYETHIIICSWIPQTVPDSAKFFAGSANFVADSAKLPVFGASLSNTVF